MTRRPLWLCALGCGIVAAVWQIAFAQAPAPGAGTAKQARPKAEPLRIETLEPELESLLKDWEQSSAKIKTLTGKHVRQEFNSVFEVEKRSEGKFFFAAPDKGRIDMAGIAPQKGEQSKRLGADKKTPYSLQEGSTERWICTGAEVLQINDKDKQVEVAPIPEELRGTNIVRSPLPFLFGLKAEEAKRRFQFRLINETDTYYALEVIPRTNQDAFERAFVKLDKKQFVPTAVILKDRSGSMEQKYEFSDLNINNSGFSGWVIERFGRDPFHPDLKSYKRVQPPATAQPGQGQQPTGQKSAVQPAGAQSSTSKPGTVRVQMQSQTTIIKATPKQPAAPK